MVYQQGVPSDLMILLGCTKCIAIVINQQKDVLKYGWSLTGTATKCIPTIVKKQNVLKPVWSLWYHAGIKKADLLCSSVDAQFLALYLWSGSQKLYQAT